MEQNTGKEVIVIIGYGWVGQANALALSFLGHQVFSYDPATPTLRYGKTWKREYDKIVRLKAPLEKDSPDTVYILSVGDRVNDQGVQDISLIQKASEGLAEAQGVIVLRSTVLPEHLASLRFDYYVPEFLHEQYAVEESLHPFLFVVGKNTAKEEPAFFADWERRAHKTFRGTPSEASYIKYLSNIWNALRISFTNEMGDLISQHAPGSAATRVIDFFFEGKSYLRYGKAYGGHCLPKDTLAFWKSHEAKGAGLIRAVHDSNERHKSFAKHSDLPEWFSRWGFSGGIRGAARKLWQRINAIPVIRNVRKTLRPVRQGLDNLYSVKTLTEQKDVWDTLARKNSLYYSHPNTASERNVQEYEFRESGKLEYEKWVAGDADLEKLGDFKDKTALDLGSGAGRHAEFFAKDFKEVIGIDISEEMNAAAVRRLKGSTNTRFLSTDGKTIPLPPCSVDFIFSRQMLQSVPERSALESYVREMHRVLKTGGQAKVELRTGAPARKSLYSYGLSFSEAEARALFENAGFSVLSLRPEGTKHLWVSAVKE